MVELGCGGGELAKVLLEHFPNADYVGLDGSETMLRATAERLRGQEKRVTLNPFRLEDLDAWTTELAQPIRCFVSSLVIHHLFDDEKRRLYEGLFRCLEPGGVLLVIDLVLPSSPFGAHALRVNWDDVTRQQSLALTGSLDAYTSISANGWNYYAEPDPMDRPASLFAQLKGLEAIGFRDVDCFWQRAGHALFGGYH